MDYTPYLSLNNYAEKLKSGEVTKEQLEGYFAKYKNYGVCNNHELIGLTESYVYVTANKFQQNKLDYNTIPSEKLLVKVYKKMEQLSPKIQVP